MMRGSVDGKFIIFKLAMNHMTPKIKQKIKSQPIS